eukprot:SAG31_NODE_118_length_24006_cov_8.219266_5_plen_173_part_00
MEQQRWFFQVCAAPKKFSHCSPAYVKVSGGMIEQLCLLSSQLPSMLARARDSKYLVCSGRAIEAAASRCLPRPLGVSLCATYLLPVFGFHLAVCPAARSDLALMMGIGRLLRDLETSQSGDLSLAGGRGSLVLTVEPPSFGQMRGHQLTDWYMLLTSKPSRSPSQFSSRRGL